MASVKFEIGFNFGSEAGWKIVPPELQVNTNGFEYYWCFEHKVTDDTNIDNINQYIDGYIDFLNYSFSSEKSKFYDDMDTVRDVLFEQRYLEPMDFKVGSVTVKYTTNNFDDVLKEDTLKSCLAYLRGE